MLFAVTYKNRGGSTGRDALERFLKWTLPAGLESKGHWQFGDGSGGFQIIEATGAAPLLEAAAAFIDVLDFTAEPLVEISEAVPILQKVLAWEDSVS